MAAPVPLGAFGLSRNATALVTSPTPTTADCAKCLNQIQNRINFLVGEVNQADAVQNSAWTGPVATKVLTVSEILMFIIPIGLAAWYIAPYITGNIDPEKIVLICAIAFIFLSYNGAQVLRGRRITGAIQQVGNEQRKRIAQVQQYQLLQQFMTMFKQFVESDAKERRPAMKQVINTRHAMTVESPSDSEVLSFDSVLPDLGELVPHLVKALDPQNPLTAALTQMYRGMQDVHALRGAVVDRRHRVQHLGFDHAESDDTVLAGGGRYDLQVQAPDTISPEMFDELDALCEGTAVKGLSRIVIGGVIFERPLKKQSQLEGEQKLLEVVTQKDGETTS
ncbi:MAG: hypothetical protein H0X51_01925 [Parachlamydiaceae bacterium]|nr:hypothetical protein [Parachlamydiaceae bacterium]